VPDVTRSVSGSGAQRLAAHVAMRSHSAGLPTVPQVTSVHGCCATALYGFHLWLHASGPAAASHQRVPNSMQELAVLRSGRCEQVSESIRSGVLMSLCSELPLMILLTLRR
jgi:hypothetical protein